jgi:hypothetical protein
MFITKIDGKIIPQRVLIEKSCTPLDVPMIVNFQKEIVDTINGHEIRGMYSHEYFLQTLHRGGNITLLYDNTTFVGFYMLIVNDCEEFEKH